MSERPSVLLYGHRLQDGSATGISRHVRELAAALARHPPGGLEISLGSSREPPGPEGPPADLPLHQPPWPRRPLHLAWTLTGRPKVDRLVGRPDLVHVLYPSTPVPTAAPVIYTLHDLDPLHHPDWFAAHERWAFRRAVRTAASRAAIICCQSAHVAEEAQAELGVGPERLAIVHPGIAPRFFTSAGPGSTGSARRTGGPGRYLLALGTISERKNLGPVIDALTSPTLHDLRLLIVGPDGHGADTVRQRVADRGVGDRVRFTGWLPSAEVEEILRGALALVQPSTDEGFGFTPLEAMACGVPAIVSAGGSPTEVIGRAAVLAEPHDPGSWTTAIERITSDPDYVTGIVSEGRAQAGKFTWERTVDRLAGVYRSVLARAA